MFEILYEDDDILAISKPPGVVVNDAATVDEMTVQSWMKTRLREQDRSTWSYLIPDDFDELYGSPAEIFEQRSGIVHRLDKDTSGVLLLAKHPGSLIQLLRQFKLRQTIKTYTCLVHGFVEVEHDTLNFPIKRATRDRKLFEVNQGGRPAITEYQRVQFFPGINLEKVAQTTYISKDMVSKLQEYQGFSLVSCQPKTGRTHQIRVHLNHIHHPIVSDQTYVGRKRRKLDLLWCPRQFLHAARLQFTHPKTGEMVSIEAPLSPDLEQALAVLLP